MNSYETSWKEILALISPVGQRQIVDFVRQARDERGAGWLEEIKTEYPTFSWIVNLVCNYTAGEALAALQEQYPTYPLWIAKQQLLTLHAVLRAEIEKPRG